MRDVILGAGLLAWAVFLFWPLRGLFVVIGLFWLFMVVTEWLMGR